MRIETKKNLITKKRMVLAVAVVATLGCGIATYALSRQQPRVETSSSAPQPSKSDKQQAENLTNNPGNKTSTVNTDMPKPVTPNTQSDKATLHMSSSATTTDGMVYIRGGIDNAVVTDGVCYAQLSGPAGESIRKDTTLLQNPSTTDCKTISMSAGELSRGAWSAKLYYSSDKAEGASNAVSFEIN